MPKTLLAASLVFVLSACATQKAAAPVQTVAAPASAVSAVTQVQQVASAGPSRRDVVKKILPHNVRMMVLDGDVAKRTASGVVVGSEATSSGQASYVVTNAHAVDARGLTNPRLVVVVDGEEGEAFDYYAEVVAMGKAPEMDLALLKIRGVALSPATLSDDAQVSLGEDVVVVASPFGKSLSLSGGMVSQVDWDRDAKLPWMLKTDAPIGYGASGGGLYSLEDGRLLGIVEGYRTAKVGFAVQEQSYSFDVPMPGETFAAPVAKLRLFLAKKGYGRLLDTTPLQARAGASR